MRLRQGIPAKPAAWEITSRVYEERKRQGWAHAWADYHADQAGRLEAVLTERVAYHRQEESHYRAMLAIQAKGEEYG